MVGQPEIESEVDALLRLDEAVELAAGLVASIADSNQLRCLFIKGLSAVAAGMRPIRPSSDTDVLVHPDHVQELLDQLSIRGWKRRPIIEGMGIPSHSHTVYHPHWACDIDIHFRFPGLEASPEEAFESLDGDSTIFLFAGVPARVPSKAGMILVQITHALRSAGSDGKLSPSAKEDYEFLRRRGQCILWDELVTVLNGTSSWAAMQPYISEVYPKFVLGVEFPAPSADWRIRTRKTHTGQMRFAALLIAPWKAKPRIIFRSLYPSRQELAAKHLPLLESSRRELAVYRIARLNLFASKFWHFAQKRMFWARSTRE